MSEAAFAHDHQLLRWVASQFPNLPHIQSHLNRIADGLEKAAEEAASSLIVVGGAVAGSALGGAEE